MDGRRGRMLGRLAAALTGAVLTLASAPAFAVVLDGKDWAQPAAFPGFSWLQVATVCPPGGGACKGSLGDTSFDGWIWATADEVGSLFHSIEPSFPGQGRGLLLKSMGGPPEDIFFGPGGFVPTSMSGPRKTVEAWTATRKIDVPPMNDFDSYLAFVSSAPSELTLWTNVEARGRNLSSGVWLYQETVSIPEPSSLVLLAAALAALLALRRRVA